MRLRHLVGAAMAAAALSACGGDDTNGTSQGNPSAGGNPPSGGGAQTQLSTADKIKALEQAGKLPTLDRSSDVKGPDLNANGIRDDIDVWIEKQGLGNAEKKAVQQLSRGLQVALLVDLTNPTAIRDAATANNLAVKCVITRSPDAGSGYRTVTDLEKITANTKSRVKAYLAYNATLDGTVSKSPEGDGCAE
ncbi:hypothetical protein P3W85_14595 [Cupriavidus basilensis]|uniref:Lipoprotein n=1 Tax=Cupriavidus basilensis TaxID=68895 RepID=A0ABT6ANI1_9BURK|nr:hypothetical protein [Cupriavidus basilensis]MDF3834175.1 hypothetical protein [Cupriavidus basilensis]